MFTDKNGSLIPGWVESVVLGKCLMWGSNGLDAVLVSVRSLCLTDIMIWVLM